MKPPQESASKKSDTHWYPRYPGDYHRDTSDLSLTEHGVYAVLLDHYYSTGKPLPANASRLQTICKAFAPADVEALHHVLREFFVETPEGYRNQRADRELEKRQKISSKRREAANVRHAIAPANAPALAPANAHTATATATIAAAQLAGANFVAVTDEQVDRLCATGEVRAKVTDNRIINDWVKAGLTLGQIERAIRLKRAKMAEPPGSLSFYEGCVRDLLKPPPVKSDRQPVAPPRPAKRQLADVMAADQERPIASPG